MQKLQKLDVYMMQIESIETVSEAIKMFNQVQVLKSVLESVGRFRKESVKYAKLEAAALIQIVELEGEHKLRSKRLADTARWLYGMDETERIRYISMCEDGLTIDNVYMRELGDEQRLQEKIDSLCFSRDWYVEQVKKDGMIDLTHFAQDVRKKLKYENAPIAEDIIDGARKRLRDAGAVGVGRGTGLYFIPEKMEYHTDEIAKAISQRVQGVYDDLESIKDLVLLAGERKLDMDEVCVAFDPFVALRNGYDSVVYILLWLADCGMFEDARYNSIKRAFINLKSKYFKEHSMKFTKQFVGESGD